MHSSLAHALCFEHLRPLGEGAVDVELPQRRLAEDMKSQRCKGGSLVYDVAKSNVVQSPKRQTSKWQQQL